MFEHLWILGSCFATVLGAVLGSFANVIIYRWPKDESIVSPRSRCPHCLCPIKFYDNIPVISWFLLRGKCRHCQGKIPIRYMFVEALMAILFFLVWNVHGLTWLTLEYFVFVFGLVTASFIDIDHFLLPDILTIPGTLAGLLGGFLNPERSFLESLLGFLFGFSILWFIGYAYRFLRKQDGVGGGDLKLLGWIGAVLGWKAIPFVVVISSLSGSILGLVLAAKGGRGMKTAIPFGPYLTFGSLIYVLGGEFLALEYLHWFIPGL